MNGVTTPRDANADRFHCAPHPMHKKQICGGDFVTTIKRSDFGMKYAIPALGDDVTLRITVESIKDLASRCWARTSRASARPTRGGCTSPPTATIRGPTRPRARTRATGPIRRRSPTASGIRSSARSCRRRRRHVARLLNLSDPRQVAFAPNTHEFVARIYSCFDPARPLRVLTSASEFHSFRRQTRRLQESGRLVVEEIAAAPWETFVERFVAAERAARVGPGLALARVLRFGVRGPGPGGDLRRGPARGAGLHRRLSRVLRAAGGPDAHPPARVLPRGRLQVRDVGRRRVLPRDPARMRAAPRRHRLVRLLRHAELGAGRGGALCDRRLPLLGRDLRSLGALSLQRGDGLARLDGATVADVHRHSVRMQKHFLDGLARLGASAARPTTSCRPPA